MGKVGEGAVADATGDDHLDTLLAQPAGEGAGLVFGRRLNLGVQHDLPVWIHLDQGELAAAAEVPVQAALEDRQGQSERVR